MLRLYTKFQCPTMPGTGQKVSGGGGVVVVVVWWLKPTLVFSLAQAEQFWGYILALVGVKIETSWGAIVFSFIPAGRSACGVVRGGVKKLIT